MLTGGGGGGKGGEGRGWGRIKTLKNPYKEISIKYCISLESPGNKVREAPVINALKNYQRERVLQIGK